MSKTYQNKYAAFETEIIQTVIRPKLDAVLDAGASTKADIQRKFNERFEVEVSMAAICYWMDQLGYEIKKTITIVRPDSPSPTEPTFDFDNSENPYGEPKFGGNNGAASPKVEALRV